MKKISIFALIGIVAVFSAHADDQGVPAPGGHVTPVARSAAPTQSVQPSTMNQPASAYTDGEIVAVSENIVTVDDVRGMPDDERIVVRGRLIERLGDGKYLFEDETGTITVQIDDKGWRNQTVTSADMIKLYGDVDRGTVRTEIDVDYVEKL